MLAVVVVEEEVVEEEEVVVVVGGEGEEKGVGAGLRRGSRWKFLRLPLQPETKLANKRTSDRRRI